MGFDFDKAADDAIASARKSKNEADALDQKTLQIAVELEEGLKKLSQRTDLPHTLKFSRDNTKITMISGGRRALLQIMQPDFFSFNADGEPDVLCGQQEITGLIMSWIMKRG